MTKNNGQSHRVLLGEEGVLGGSSDDLGQQSVTARSERIKVFPRILTKFQKKTQEKNTKISNAQQLIHREGFQLKKLPNLNLTTYQLHLQ
jgi:hypothetical protein